MKINRLETHDRLKHFINQQFQMGDCAQDLVNQKPFGNHPFYILCHPRTHEDGVNKKYIWSPWIWKSRAQTNCMLLKAYPGSDVTKVIWILPPREMWESFKQGTMFENTLILRSIKAFEKDKHELEAPEPDDPSPERAQMIAFEYQPQLFKRESLPDHLKPIWDQKMNERRRLKQVALVASSSSLE